MRRVSWLLAGLIYPSLSTDVNAWDDATFEYMMEMADQTDDMQVVFPVRREPMMYAYSSKEYSDMGAFLGQMAWNHLRLDNTFGYYAPLLSHNYEEHPGGLSVVGRRIAATRTSTIFEIQGDPEWVIKYQVNINSGKGVHPLLRDGLFQQALSHTAIVPRILFISPPTLFPGVVTPKTEFDLTPVERLRCHMSHRSIRFMIMERLDADMYSFSRSSGPTFYGAIEVMIELFKGLSQVHAMGIVHGDIHPGNVGIRNQRVMLLDWGLAFHIDETYDKPDLERPPMSYNHCLYSHWNLMGYRFSFRDDAFKVLLVGAMLMHGGLWTQHCTSLEEDGEGMLRFKAEDFLFDVPSRVSVVANAGVHPNQKRVVRRLLEEVLQSVRSLHGINDMPNHALVVSKLSKIKKMIDKRRESAKGRH